MGKDEQAFQLFYKQTASSLRAYVARSLGSVDQADDVVQEAYLRFLRSPPGYGNDKQVRAYLFRIASRLLIDHWRKHKRAETVPDVEVAAEDVSPHMQMRIDMEQIFNELSPQQRQLLWLAYVEKVDHREIATATGVGERSVRVLLYRARQKLASLIAEKKVV